MKKLLLVTGIVALYAFGQAHTLEKVPVPPTNINLSNPSSTLGTAKVSYGAGGSGAIDATLTLNHLMDFKVEGLGRTFLMYRTNTLFV